VITPNQPSIESAALLRFISGASPADEHLTISQWMDADPAHRAEVDLLARAWDRGSHPPTLAWPTQSLWERLEKQIREMDVRPSGGVAPRSRSIGGRPLVLVPPAKRPMWRSTPHWAAAATILTVGVGLAAQVGMLPGDESAVVDERTYTTQPGERADLVLADGSKVVLGGASTLRVPETFGKSARELYLDGQAYFDVTHDSSRTLRVHTRRSVAEDLGTSFIVTAYSSDSTEQIAVTKGSVAVQGSGEPVVLHANDVGSVSAAGAVSAQRNAGAERYLGWMSGDAYFDDTVLADAATTLMRQYGVKLWITDPKLAKRRFSGPITVKNLHADLSALALLLDARYERQGNTVMLTPRRQPPQP
jgi:ferric-dicitrate binding protein FerR (iron transport regulator)